VESVKPHAACLRARRNGLGWAVRRVQAPRRP